MTRQELIERYFSVVVQEGLYPVKGNLQFYLKYLFSDINFEGRRMLDIGGGSGLFSFYAACMGAREVICLEPQIEGSQSNAIEKFKKVHTHISLDQVNLETTAFQSFDSGSKKFDLVLLHNSINHLDEQACINLLKDQAAREVYRTILSKISSLSNTGAKLIICDCSRDNFFPAVGLKNPIDRSIEWHKHHPPEVWADLLSEIGFCNPRVHWTSFNTLRFPGRLLLGNRLMSYFLTSNFCLKMEKTENRH